jgi:16S rRNA (adenine1518-N6/adenine1519-N6)-dimethyltransferase
MVIREQPPVQVVREEILFRTIRASFIQRRKKLLNGLTSAFAPKVSKDQLRQALSNCGFDENVRGEQLSLEEFAALSNEIAGLL